MNHMDIRNLAQGLAPVVKGFVEQATAPLLARIVALEAQAEVATTGSASLVVDWDERFDRLSAKLAEVAEKAARATEAMEKQFDQTDKRLTAKFDADAMAEQITASLEIKLTEVDGIAGDAMRTGQQVAEAVKALENKVEIIERGLTEARDAHVAAETSELRSEVAELRALVDAIPEPQAVELPDVQRMVDEAVAAVPKPSDGQPGRDGADANPELIRAMVAEAVAEIPRPEDGKSVTLADLAPMVAEAAQRAVDALPVAKDGVGLAGAIIDRAGSLIVTLTDGTTRDLGPVVGKDGRDGADGKNGERGEPGFNLDDFDVDIKDERTIVLKFARGDVLETYELAFPVMIYRGVYKDDQAYERGDMVSRGGNLYHCNAPTTDKPESGSEAWTLSARRGRDGKDGAPGQKGEPGQKGDPGLNGRNWT